LPPGAVKRLGSPAFRIGRPAKALEYSPDGKRIAAVTAGRLTIWSVPDGALVKEFAAGTIITARYSPDGKYLGCLERILTRTPAAAGQQSESKYFYSFTLLDTASWKQIDKIDDLDQPGSFAFLPGGGQLILSVRGECFVYGVPRLNRVGSFKTVVPDAPAEAVRWGGHLLSFRMTAFSPDGTLAVSLAGPEVIFWDVKALKIRRRHKLRQANLVAMNVLDDNKTLLFSCAPRSGVTEDFYRWNFGAPDPKATWPRIATRSSAGRGSVAISPKGTHVAKAYWRRHSISKADEVAETTLSVTDVATGKSRQLAEGLPWISALAFSPDGKTLATSGHDMALRFWDLATRKPLPLPGFVEAPIEAIALAAD